MKRSASLTIEQIKEKTYGYWTVIEEAPKRLFIDKKGVPLWIRVMFCICICGTEKKVRLGELTSGHTKSCGCMKAKLISHTSNKTGRPATTCPQGERKTSEFIAWSGAIDRCYNKNSHKWIDYGGRGIKVCEQWIEEGKGYLNFINDMGRKPKGFLLDREDVNGDYNKENCRWVSSSYSAYNTRTSKRNTSGFPGVVFREKLNKWQARIDKDNKRYHLGLFDSKEAAIEARKEAEIFHYGFLKSKITGEILNE